MRKKGSNFFEEHLQWIVLTIVGLVCMWLLITRVLISPNVVSYDNKKFGSGDIDIYINEQAEFLKYKLNRKPEPSKPYEARFPDFLALVDSALSDIDAGIYLPQPINSLREVGSKPKYTLPVIGEVNDVGVEHFRAVAYIPTEELNEENIGKVDYEPNDLDFVTVEAKFDVAKLVENFYESFAGEDVNEQWRDPCLAGPVFATAQLQRQELNTDGSWGDWQIVPRTRIDPRQELFEVIEDVQDLPAGGIKVCLLQFDDAQVRMDLLQPQAYQIASAKEEWFPPCLHKKYVEHQSAIRVQERRESLEAKKAEREQQREKARAGRSERSRKSKTEVRTGEGAGPGMGMGMGMGMGPGMGMGMGGHPGMGPGIDKMRERGKKDRESRKERRKREREERSTRSKEVATSISDIEDELDEILITEQTDIAEMTEPLSFWAHDDTIEPQKSYRYRIRIGVFNPIAGTNQFSKQDEDKKKDVILWSSFSKLTEPVEIPGTLYFFPVDIQEATETVTVQVCRYSLGYWYSENFIIKAGEVIGRSVDSDQTGSEKGITIPETIDYGTGAVLVDVTRATDWPVGKNMRARLYFDMLYSFDITNIKRMPVKKRYWPRELQIKFDEIKEAEKEPKEPLRPMGDRRDRERRPQQLQPGQMPGMFPGMFPGEMPMMFPGFE